MENFIAMDFETTGLVPWEHAPLTLGLVNDDIELYVKMHPGRRFPVQAEAMEVNGIVLDEVSRWRSATLQDIDIWRDLKPLYDEHGPFTAVGLNVGVFDQQFLNIWLPNTAKLFGHRPFDLNTMFRTKYGHNWRDYRDAAYAGAFTDTDLTEDNLHDAFSDAMLAWAMFQSEMGEVLADTRSPAEIEGTEGDV